MFKINVKTRRKSNGGGEGGYSLFTFTLLNRGFPAVETIYFVSIKQKK